MEDTRSLPSQLRCQQFKLLCWGAVEGAASRNEVSKTERLILVRREKEAKSALSPPVWCICISLGNLLFQWQHHFCLCSLLSVHPDEQTVWGANVIACQWDLKKCIYDITVKTFVLRNSAPVYIWCPFLHLVILKSESCCCFNSTQQVQYIRTLGSGSDCNGKGLAANS